MNRVLLIDADILAYEAASACEVATEFEEGYWTWHCDFNEVQATFLGSLERIKDTLDATAVKLCLTDSLGNFRKAVLPTYKGNRSNVKKPLTLKAIREWLIEEHEAYLKPGLEGDDCMGILATRPNPGREERIIVSADKDMKSIPGLLCRWPNPEIVEVTETEADYYHLFQTLIGDQTDGYSGCPGIGPKKAEGIIGPSAPCDLDMVKTHWPSVVRAYEGKGLTEADALVQARVARILRASDYDFTRKEPILWTP